MRSKKKRFGRRRGKFSGLKLIIEDNKGNVSTYFVPVKKQRMVTDRSYNIEQAMRVNRRKFWKIADNSINISDPETLIDKEIVLKRGNTRFSGKVRNVVYCLYKLPEGDPVPFPPPPRS